MPRIRTIKPDHWEDEAWNKVSRDSHLLWIAMKNFADDRGVITNNPVLIKNKAFPASEDIRTKDVTAWLKELEGNDFLEPLTWNEKGFYVMDFTNEKIDKPQPSIIPEAYLLEHSRIFANILSVEERKGKESKGVGEDCAKAPPTSDDVFVFLKEKSGWDEKKCRNEAEKFCDHYEKVGWRTPSGPIVSWKSAASGWIRKDASFNGKNKIEPFPDRWDFKYAGTLDTDQLKAYFTHLESLGWAKTGQKNGYPVWEKVK